MTRYHVATEQNCRLVREAINAAWNATPAAQVVTHVVNGVVVGTEPKAQYLARLGLPADHEQLVHADRLIVAGTDAALELPDTGRTGEEIGKLLGRGGLPSAASLVPVTRPREHSRLPAGVRDVLDDRYVDEQLAEEDTPQKRQQIRDELTNGGRAAAALARRDARGARGELDRAIGLGGGGRAR